MGVVEDRAGSQVVLAHPEGLLDVPQLVVGGDDLTGAHQAGRDVGDVALEVLGELLGSVLVALIQWKNEVFSSSGLVERVSRTSAAVVMLV